MADDKQDGKDSPAAIWARYSQIALVIPTAVVVGLFAGKILDHYLHTRWLFLVGIIIGAAAGFIDVIRTVIRQTR